MVIHTIIACLVHNIARGLPANAGDDRASPTTHSTVKKIHNKATASSMMLQVSPTVNGDLVNFDSSLANQNAAAINYYASRSRGKATVLADVHIPSEIMPLAID